MAARYSRDVLGRYSVSLPSAVLNAGLTAISLLLWRWNHASVQCRVTRVTIDASVSTTFFAAGVPISIGMYRASLWTSQGTTGTGLTIASQGKLNSRMNDSVLGSGDARWAGAAAFPTATETGTVTLEAAPLAQVTQGAPITASLAPTLIWPVPIWDATRNEDDALELGFQEGFVLKLIAAAPATGTWKLGTRVEWTECAGNGMA